MTERTALGEAILKHWRAHCPQMVKDLKKTKSLNQALFAAQERTGDLLYELVSVKKMDYHAAWELAMQEWAVRETGTPKPEATRRKSGQQASRASKSRISCRNRGSRRRRGTSA